MKIFAVYKHDTLPPGEDIKFRLIGSNESYWNMQAVKIGFSWPVFFLSVFLTVLGPLIYSSRIRSGKFALVILAIGYGFWAAEKFAFWAANYIFPNSIIFSENIDWRVIVLYFCFRAVLEGGVLGALANKFRVKKLISLGYKKIGETQAEHKAAAMTEITGIPAIMENMEGKPA